MHINLRNILVIAIPAGAAPSAYADVVTDWNATAGDIVVAAKLPPAMPCPAMAVVQSAVYEDVNSITKRYPSDRVKLDAAPGASPEVAVAAANRTTLARLAPARQAALDSAFQAAVAAIPDGLAKIEGIAVGETPRKPPWQRLRPHRRYHLEQGGAGTAPFAQVAREQRKEVS